MQTSRRALKEEIERCIYESLPHLRKMVTENFDVRIRMWQQRFGGYFPYVWCKHNSILYALRFNNKNNNSKKKLRFLFISNILR